VPVSALLYRPQEQAPGKRGARRQRACCSPAPLRHRQAASGICWCLDLALHGLVVLAIDPWGQGERFQYAAPGHQGTLVPGGTFEHSYTGLQCFLTGSTVARYFAWDSVRGVDVLAALPEVDPARIGVTGNSGGGAQTTLLMMADARLAAAMPCTFISSVLSIYDTGQVLDGEMSAAAPLGLGLDHADLLANFAPQPPAGRGAIPRLLPHRSHSGAVEAPGQSTPAMSATSNPADCGRHHAYSEELSERAVRFFFPASWTPRSGSRRGHPDAPGARPGVQPHRPALPGSNRHPRVYELNREFLSPSPFRRAGERRGSARAGGRVGGNARAGHHAHPARY
jgi:hypothetical protein